ncbi:hypothetical protein EOPP23_10015 [Endozoicomonas sp. OPT23]|uniref:hypothetical protein n=1 Tax=Endozoicomonas sp. OPT23 TaxID=2072845 RepID=UPI00129AB1E8|nr:hypothetical protein [Endozoicomonas sp. OPT23]MRI33318.1 hypothetical protein [Endozoicomonas sp. OPT23]
MPNTIPPNTDPVSATLYSTPESSEKKSSETRSAIPKAPVHTRLWERKSLKDRKLTKLQHFVVFLNRILLKPLRIFQGTFNALMPDFNITKKITEVKINKYWKRFNDPNKAYVLLFMNPYGESVQHAAIVLGSSEGKQADDKSNYASWSFDDKKTVVGPFLACSKNNDFKSDFFNHGKPVIIELPNVDTQAMKHKWKLIQKRHEYYQLIGFNCSSVAARLIRAGIKGKGLQNVFRDVSPKGYWTPRDVCNLAETLKLSLDES